MVRKLKMIETLFKLENIKYVISVDDCFAIPEAEQLREELYIDSIASFSKVKPLFERYCNTEAITEIQEMIDLSIDPSANIQSFIESLESENVKECICDLHPDKSTFFNDKKGILDFLEKLKSDGIIEKYITVPSTHEAQMLDTESYGMTNGSILWLIDKSFSNANESATAGMEFAKNKVKQTKEYNNYIFMLTTISSTSEKDEDVEIEFDKILAESETENPSFIYFISKNLILTKKYERIAKNLAFGFKRKQCYKLIDAYTECIRRSCDKAIDDLHKIDQKTLNYVFTKKVQNNGESYFDFFNSLVRIFQEEEYSYLLSTKKMNISDNISHYQKLCNDIPQESNNITEVQNILSEVRKKELYDIYINQKHNEISTGDVFKIKNDYYVLVTQSCDTYLRGDGKRKLDKAILLKVKENPNTQYKYELSCFNDFEKEYNKPAVIFQENCIVPFEILDLCVVNEDGKSCIDTALFSDDKALEFCYTSNFKNRYKSIKQLFFEVYKSKSILDEFWKHHDKKLDIENLKKAYDYLLTADTNIKNFNINGTLMIYPVQRISRLNELTTIDLLKEYGNILSRVGQPFDFIKKTE